MTDDTLETLKQDVYLMKSGPLHIQVRVLDCRAVFGRVDVLVSPIAGTGEQWVNLNSLVKEGEK